MSLKISRMLHAGYLLEYAECKIAFDPIWENPFSHNCHAFPDVQFDTDKIKTIKFDSVFISHFHDDHFSLESLNLLDKKTPIYAFSHFDEVFSLIKKLGFTEVYPLVLNKTLKIGPFEILPRPALDVDVDSIFHIKVNDLNILNVVDSWIDPDTLKILAESKWDLILWPFQTMREIEVIAPSRANPASREIPAEWRHQLEQLNPRYVVPSSCQFQMEDWSWYNQAFFPISYKQFEKEIKTLLPEAQVVRMNPSVSIFLDRDSMETTTSLCWIKPLGPQDVDYEYREDLKPPTTAEIAKHFAALNEKQKMKVLDYCQSELLKKYNSLDAPLDPYFEKAKLWKLSLYDHDGKLSNYYYRIQDSKITALPSIPDDPIEWLTEIPMAKLYAALEEGEALTSLYMRINDMIFMADIEKQIQSADIMEDPLIRCLFTGVFGTYQTAQLKSLIP